MCGYTEVGRLTLSSHLLAVIAVVAVVTLVAVHGAELAVVRVREGAEQLGVVEVLLSRLVLRVVAALAVRVVEAHAYAAVGARVHGRIHAVVEGALLADGRNVELVGHAHLKVNLLLGKDERNGGDSYGSGGDRREDLHLGC